MLQLNLIKKRNTLLQHFINNGLIYIECRFESFVKKELKELKDMYQMMEHLYERLKNYSESDYYGFHMPGHKRNKNVTGAELPYEIDITEIEGFDDLHHAEGILKELQNYAAKVFHADETHYLVNGSTVGLLSAVMGCTERGGKILTVRNCHKSVYNAIYMNELEPVYIYPQFDTEQDLNGEIKVEELKEILASDQDST